MEKTQIVGGVQLVAAKQFLQVGFQPGLRVLTQQFVNMVASVRFECQQRFIDQMSKSARRNTRHHCCRFTAEATAKHRQNAEDALFFVAKPPPGLFKDSLHTLMTFWDIA